MHKLKKYLEKYLPVLNALLFYFFKREKCGLAGVTQLFERHPVLREALLV